MAEGLGFAFRFGAREGGEGKGEEALRNARFSFFEETMEREGIRHLLLGHQADDVAETFLARAATGSGVEGLSAPRPVSRHRSRWEHWRIRPLLAVSSASIRSFLADMGLGAVEDSSNRSDQYLRNRLRRDVLPRWKEALPDRDILGGVARTRHLLEETADFVEQSVRRILPGGCRRPVLPVSRLGKAHPACIRFAVQRWLAHHALKLSPVAVEEVLAAVGASSEAKGKWAAGSDTWIRLEGGRLRIDRKDRWALWGPVGFSVPQKLFFPGGGMLESRLIPVDAPTTGRVLAGRIDPSREAVLAVGDPTVTLRVRRRRNGDRVHLLGAPGSRKLKDCLTDRKIERGRREVLPVILLGGEIAWVPGLPPAERFRVRGGEELLLGLTYHPS